MTASFGDRRRAMSQSIAGLGIAAATLLGSSGPALADPSVVPTPTPKPTVVAEGAAAAGAATATATAAPSSGDILDKLADEYMIGAGGGQLSNLLKVSLKLRGMGFKPSKQYLDGIEAALKYRPNQLPLISALKDTIAYQQKLRAQMEILSQAQGRQNPGGAAMGGGQMPAAAPAAAPPIPPPPGAPVVPAAPPPPGVPPVPPPPQP
ncbi:MAG: hypothetical protein FGM52_11620 [Mycobacterium sp.]|nr:hypothetical protein [Mycobacterium sp.]